MQWTVLNAFGGLAWLAGLMFAKGTALPLGNLLVGSDQHVMVGILCSLTGLAVLLWANFRTPA